MNEVNGMNEMEWNEMKMKMKMKWNGMKRNGMEWNEMKLIK